MFEPRYLAGTSPSGLFPRSLLQHRLVSFAAIGVICTAAFAILYSLMRNATGPLEANVGAFSVTAIFNFLANRKLTFRAHQGDFTRQAAGYFAVYVFGLGVSSAALWLALHAVSHPSGPQELALAVGSSALATVIRFALLTQLVFRPSAPREPAVG
jgi:putative flippase GtrA